VVAHRCGIGWVNVVVVLSCPLAVFVLFFLFFFFVVVVVVVVVSE
jgi:hypothetical protein